MDSGINTSFVSRSHWHSTTFSSRNFVIFLRSNTIRLQWVSHICSTWDWARIFFLSTESPALPWCQGYGRSLWLFLCPTGLNRMQVTCALKTERTQPHKPPESGVCLGGNNLTTHFTPFRVTVQNRMTLQALWFRQGNVRILIRGENLGEAEWPLQLQINF